MTFRDFNYLVTQSFKEWSADKASRLAASLAYYTIFSIPPLLIIILAIASQVFADAPARVTAEINNFVGETGGEAITGMLENASQPGNSLIAAIISVITLFLGASGVFGQLQEALNTIWEVQADPNRGFLENLKARFFSFTMVLGVGFLMLVSLIISASLTALDDFISGIAPEAIILTRIINLVVSFAIIVLLFALIYKIIPDVTIAWRDVWVGALVTAVLFSIGKWAIGFYLGRTAPASAYGAAGSLIVILLWVYYSAQILFLGAEFTQVYASRYGAALAPERGAIPLTEAVRIQQGIPKQETIERKQAETDRIAITTPTIPRHTAVPQPSPAVQQGARKFHQAVINVLAVPMAVWQWTKRVTR